MNITVQIAIPGVPYSVNKVEFNTDWLTREQIADKIQQMKSLSEKINEQYMGISPTDVQLREENKILKQLNEKLGVASEQKSIMIAALKRKLWDEEFEIVRDEVIQSGDYKSVSIHTSKENG